MQQQNMTCGHCGTHGPIDWLEEEEVYRLREHTGVFLSFNEGWKVMASHCPRCHGVTFTVASLPGTAPELLWPGRAHVRGDAPPSTADHFRAVWSDLAERGLCDALDGAEYRRVLRAWKEADEPANVTGFIICRANRGPGYSAADLRRLIRERRGGQ